METPSPIQEWQIDALKVLDQKPDPETRFQVFERIAATTTRKLELLRARSADEMQALVDSTAGNPAANADGDPLKVVFDDRGANTLSAAQVASYLDSQLFPPDSTFLAGAERSNKERGIHIPDFIVRREYGEIEELHNRIAKLIRLLYQHFSEECLNLIFGLFDFWIRDKAGQSIFSAEEVINTETARKKEIAERLIAKMPTLEPGEEDKILRWALGGRFYLRLSKDHLAWKEKLDLLKQLLETKSSFRRKLLRSLRHLTLTADRLVSSALVRQGWETISNIDEVTDHEWWSYARDAHAYIKQRAAEGDEDMQKLFANEKSRERFELRDRRMKAFLELHPDPPPAEEIRKLKDVIGCDRYRAELTRLDEDHNPRGYDEKQREILGRVSSAVSRYIIEQTKGREEEIPSWSQGFPINFEDSKSGTCFTGPWFIAIMLMECGINYDDLLYAHVNHAHNGQLGGHGGLILKTRLRHNVFIDHGLNFASRDLPTASASSKEEADLVNALLDCKIREAVTILFGRHEVDRIHRHIQLMPLVNGFASGHLYHVGLSFLTGGKFTHAKHALELALSFNRHDPDILYYLGSIEIQEGNIAEAQAYFIEALKIFPDHLFSRFGLGECAVRLGNTEEAKGYFAVVAESPFSIWRANALKDKAKQFASMREQDLRREFAVAGPVEPTV